MFQARAHYQLSVAEFTRLRDFLSAYSGIYLDPTRQRILEQALGRRMTATGSDLATYERRIATDREELQRFAELVLNHETSFFRNQPHMRALREVLLPELHRRKPGGEPIRIWSAGCATGEEAYSLAITALEALPFGKRKIQVWATDLSEAALEQAREGNYTARELANVPPELLARYFRPHADGYVVDERVKSLVSFGQVNLLEPLPAQANGVDIIFCQNVMIYFQQATKQAILAQFHQALPELGMLCLGFSETLWNVFDAFHTREVLGAYVYYKETYRSTPVKPENKRQHPQISSPRRPTTQPLAVRPRETRPLELPASERLDDAELARRVQALLAEGKIEQALGALNRIPSSSQHAAQAIMAMARAYADRGQLDLALAQAKRVIDIDAMHHEATLLLGVLYGRRGMWDLAVAQLERARYLESTAPLVSFHLAEAYRQQGRIKDAVREYRNTLRKLQIYPTDSVVDGVAVGWLRGSCQQQMNQLSQHRGEH